MSKRMLPNSVVTRWFVSLAVLVGVVCGAGPGDSWAGGMMYWTDPRSGKIQRANLDSTDVEDLVTGLDAPEGIALDVAGGKMYWTEVPAEKIRRANLDGTEVEDLVTSSHPRAIALDVAGGKMYWTDVFDGIQRANLDGTDVEILVTGLDAPKGMTLDVVVGKMYWTDVGTDTIQRANLDGTEVEVLVTELESPNGITLDGDGGKMYWTEGFDRRTGKIRRANLDGTNIEDLMTGLEAPLGIALDVAAGKMYWSDPRARTIQRTDLEGTGMIEDLLMAPMVASPDGLALDISILTLINKAGAQRNQELNPLSVLLNKGVWFEDVGFGTALSYVFRINSATGAPIGTRGIFFPQGPGAVTGFAWDLNGNVLTLAFASTRFSIRLLAYDPTRDILHIQGPPGMANAWVGCRSNFIPAAIPRLVVAGLCR